MNRSRRVLWLPSSRAEVCKILYCTSEIALVLYFSRIVPKLSVQDVYNSIEFDRARNQKNRFHTNIYLFIIWWLVVDLSSWEIIRTKLQNDEKAEREAGRRQKLRASCNRKTRIHKRTKITWIFYYKYIYHEYNLNMYSQSKKSMCIHWIVCIRFIDRNGESIF